MDKKCKEHPKYKAIRAPRATVKHPQGCRTCWETFDPEGEAYEPSFGQEGDDK